MAVDAEREEVTLIGRVTDEAQRSQRLQGAASRTRESCSGLLACFSLAGACAEARDEASLHPLVEEISRMSFIPGDPEERRAPLLADRYEATNGEFFRFVAESGYRADGPGFLFHWRGNGGRRVPPQGLEEHPVVFVSRSDAEAFAAWKQKRLPTVSEWERLACGRPAASFLPRPPPVQYPWGGAWFPLFCNTFELGLDRTTAVGTFESGKSVSGCYDVAGNVWEWALPDGEGGLGLVKGGAFDFGKDKSSCYESLEVDPGQRTHDIGFRCVVEFEAFLASRFRGFHPGPEEARVLRRLAGQWGPAAEAPLSRLGGKEGLDEGLLRDLREAVKGR